MTERGFDFSKQANVVDILGIVDLFDSENLDYSFNIEADKNEKGHIGLFSSENIYPGEHKRIVSVKKQCIKEVEFDEGRVMEHDHGSEGITEIIIVDDNTVYAGLPGKASFSIGKYKIYIIAPGVRHGSQEKPSSGQWLSVKFKDL